MKTKSGFSSKLGAIAAVAGSAIGLGNIWRFPWLTGKYGGASFLFIYLACILMVGFPVMIAAFVIGRTTKKNTVGAFKELAPGKPWYLCGWLGLFASVVTLSFYSVVAGWSLKYIVFGLTNSFAGKTGEQLGQMFGAFSGGAVSPVIYHLIFMVLTGGVVILGVQNGIEKMSKILMPILFVLLIILVGNSLTLSGAKEGLTFLFKPDFSAINMTVILLALGQAFFTLSLGMGTMITYGSYIRDEDSLTKTSLQVIVADTLVALLAGVVIFPAAFTYNVEVTEGAGFAFIALPAIFSEMFGGQILSVLFFFLLAIAALTSSISMLEVPIAFLEQELKMDRKKAVIGICLVASILGAFCALSLGAVDIKLFGATLMDAAAYLTSNILLPFVGLMVIIFFGYFMDKKVVAQQVNIKNKNLYRFFMFFAKFVAPVATFIVFLYSIGLVDKILALLGYTA